jgi:hypothetical protein
MDDEKPQPIAVNPATSVIVSALGAVRAAVLGVADTLQRFESRQSPGLYRILPAASASAAVLAPGFPAQSTRLRVIEWVIAVDAAGTYGVQVGGTPIVQVEFGAAGTLIVPLPLTIDRAAEVTTSGTAANIVDSFLITVTE